MKNIKLNSEVFGLVFGPGKIIELYEDSFYKYMVEFNNGFQVPFTAEGIPSWGNFLYRTIFHKDDIDLEQLDFSPVEKLPSPKKIIKWKNKHLLEVKCPSGLWTSSSKCPDHYLEKLLENEQFWMFRKSYAE